MNITYLSKEILFIIFLKLNDTDLISLCKTNKYFKEEVYNNYIWSYKLKKLKKYSEDIQELKKEFINARELYKLVKSLILVKEVFDLNWRLIDIYNSKKNKFIRSKYQKNTKFITSEKFKKA